MIFKIACNLEDFESSSIDLAQDLAKLNLTGNNQADNCLSDAEKDCVLEKKMRRCLHTQKQFLQIDNGKNL